MPNGAKIDDVFPKKAMLNFGILVNCSLILEHETKQNKKCHLKSKISSFHWCGFLV